MCVVCVLVGHVARDDIAGLKDDYLTGDFEFDPLNLAPRKNTDKFLEQRSKVRHTSPPAGGAPVLDLAGLTA